MGVTLAHTHLIPAPLSTSHRMPELELVGLIDLSQTPATTEALDILDVLEAEAILVIREVAAEYHRPVLLLSGDKDSAVMLYLARKVFWSTLILFPILRVDTGHNPPELPAYRDWMVEELGLRLVMVRVQGYIGDGRPRECTDNTRNPFQTIPFLDAIEEGGFDGVFGGGCHDEEKTRAKERIASPRDEFGRWGPRNQHPELWNLFNPRHRPGEHVRASPSGNWTELDVWRYAGREDTALPGLYYAHECEVLLHDGMWLMAGDVSRLRNDEQVVTHTACYRTVGDMSYTGAVESTATTNHDIILEVAVSILTRWGATRADDRLSEATIEDREEEGCF